MARILIVLIFWSLTSELFGFQMNCSVFPQRRLKHWLKHWLHPCLNKLLRKASWQNTPLGVEDVREFHEFQELGLPRKFDCVSAAAVKVLCCQVAPGQFVWISNWTTIAPYLSFIWTNSAKPREYFGVKIVEYERFEFSDRSRMYLSANSMESILCNQPAHERTKLMTWPVNRCGSQFGYCIEDMACALLWSVR